MLTVLVVGLAPGAFGNAFKGSPFGPFSITLAADLAAARAARVSRNFDALVIGADAMGSGDAAGRSLDAHAAMLVVVASGAEPKLLLAWLAHGAEDVLAPADMEPAVLARRVRGAIERKRLERDSRKAYSTDLATGLPHQQQLVEHMSQLLALREREPAPMAVLVMRVEGFATTEGRLGPQAADSLRRKIGVRLRAAVRASDVVASIDDESFAVLLGSLLSPGDAERVAAKLVQVLMQPFSVGGISVAIAVAMGIGQFPADGTQPDQLLRKAIGMALDEPAQGRIGMANFQETGSRPVEAANDA
jgi:diguanylate cyclase (GGDEF)-like protein